MHIAGTKVNILGSGAFLHNNDVAIIIAPGIVAKVAVILEEDDEVGLRPFLGDENSAIVNIRLDVGLVK
jgi:hypothetical protein